MQPPDPLPMAFHETLKAFSLLVLISTKNRLLGITLEN
jgi:hypothetical protein